MAGSSQVSNKSSPRAAGPSRRWLWWIVLSPMVWAVHFLACYLSAAIWCAKLADTADSVRPLQWAVAWVTAIALGVIVWAGAVSYRQFRRGNPPVPYDFDDPADRTHFQGYTAFLLALLSCVATLFTALVFVLVGSCD
ncbi:MAG: hypothetical protein KDA45_12840 [Planctomycetales bacterium]|nr:hypothetical protein [Planctomycetales bacterium]